jgi:adenylosuccinate lyase
MLQAFGELAEPIGGEQVGSSAMAYKQKTMRSERIASLARFVCSLEPNANQTHSVQFLERTLDDSANRRLVIPEAFLAADAALTLVRNVVQGLQVHRARIRQRIAEELPFMATEALIVRAVRNGGDRQVAHETIRRHSVAAAKSMRENGGHNDLLERLGGDATFGVPLDDLRAVTDAARFVGRAPQQVQEFLAEVIEPLLAAHPETAEAEEVKV